MVVGVVIAVGKGILTLVSAIGVYIHALTGRVEMSYSRPDSSDPAWKYSFWPKTNDKNCLECKLCGNRYNGGIRRMKVHLTGIGTDARKCGLATDDIQYEIIEYMKKKKRKGLEKDDDSLSSGASSKKLPRVGISVDANVAFSPAKVQCQTTVDDHNLEKIEERNINGEAYMKAGKLLMEKRKCLIYAPCVSHSINLILTDFSETPVTKSVIMDAREVTSFIYSHKLILAFIRKETGGKELVRAGLTQSVSAFLTLQRLYTHKQSLKAWFVSEKWTQNPLSRKSYGERVSNLILSSNFWRGICHGLRVGQPLLQVLRLVHGDEKPPMGYVYAAIRYATEEIRSFFGDKHNYCENVLKVVSKRWAEQCNQPLHGAGYFLNPGYYYDRKEIECEYEAAFLACVEIMTRSPNEEDEILTQVDSYKNARDLFGKGSAIRLRSKKQPNFPASFAADDPEQVSALEEPPIDLNCLILADLCGVASERRSNLF
ncbi:hypothetical protein RJ640_026460 [Escallonia rubra]|uniref:DUF659 domain-containing protein n=1 Tax=Escallonia rubra TaxID=112253 RepID=A0AA88RHR0_9ASTE|nr:hypothetical protein RJ640_026460 [Escallonia rubra]